MNLERINLNAVSASKNVKRGQNSFLIAILPFLPDRERQV
jgi:hypothetical protein